MQASAMTGECFYSNCSVIIPRLLYSGGDLAAAIILTALVVTGISVAIHLSVFYWIYKYKLKPRMKGEVQEAKKLSSSAVITEDDGEGVQVERKVQRDTIKLSSEQRIVLPVVNRNLAYGRVDYPEDK